MKPLIFFCRWKQTFRVDFHKKKNVIIHFLRYDAFLESSKTTIFLRVWYTKIIYRFHMCISYCKYFCIYTFSPLPIVKPIKRSEAKAIISSIHFSSSQRGRNLMSYKSQARYDQGMSEYLRVRVRRMWLAVKRESAEKRS